jgi:hypothetical protein
MKGYLVSSGKTPKHVIECTLVFPFTLYIPTQDDASCCP